jgi:[amino group carrier protein]-lysine/ornithine hydrolase
LQDYPVKLLQTMLEAYSPSGSEGKLAKLLAQHMTKLGFNVRRDRVGNVIGESGDESPRILLCGHMDTVPGELPVRHDDKFLYGRGAVDAKSALAAMLVGSYLATRRSKSPLGVTVVGVVEEETTSAGVKSLIDEGASYDLAVFGEPSGANAITIGYKGCTKLQVTCQTSGGHSAAPWLSKNSIEEAFEFWKLLKTSMLRNDSAEKFPFLTGCITGIRAGEAENSIPSRAVLNIDIRIAPKIRPAEVSGQIEKLAKQYESSHAGTRIIVETRDQCPGFVGNSNSLAVQVFRWAIKRTLRGQVDLLKKTGTSDMNVFAQTHNIPMITYGPGDSTLDHTKHERIRIREYLDSIEVYAKAIERVADLYRDRGLQPVPMSQ